MRLGINIGDIILEDGDIYGDGVNVASRLEGLAEPGGICVSRNVYNQVKNKVGFGFEPMGEHRVKNIAEPITVYRVRPALGGCRRWEEGSGMAGAPLAGGGCGGAGTDRRGGGLASLLACRRPAPSAPTPVVAASAPALDPRRLAVLPFTNISAEAKEEWFADGITEEMITRLPRSPS